MTATFTPAGAVTVIPDPIPASFAMPALDAANPDVMVQNTGSAAAWIAFGPGAAVGNGTGCVTVPGGARVLLTANSDVLAATVKNPLVMSGSAAGASIMTVQTQMRGGSLVITRGTAAPLVVF